MKDAYSIGKFRFESYHEYREALDDVEKIRYISEKTDINEPGVAQRLYTLVRQGKITFKSVIGTDYMLYLSDIMIEDMEEAGHKERKKNIEWTFKFSARQVAGAVCMTMALISFLIFAASEYQDRQKVKELEEMKAEQEMSVVSEWISGRVADKLEEQRKQEETPIVAEVEMVENEIHGANREMVQEEPKEPEVLPEYRELYAQNQDLAGWISVEGTQIDYPVMQSGMEEAEYYLHYNFNRQEDINGSIFMDARNDYEKPDDNLILYGHNMKSGMMFGGLKQYLDKNYWKEHQMLSFNTLYERAQYQIVAVCLSKVSYQDEEEMRYYNFLDAETKEEFEAYVNKINEWNVFDEPVELNYGDQMLTLSTCNNYTEDGRLFLIAKKCF